MCDVRPMTNYLAIVFFYLTAPPIFLFLASEISHLGRGTRLRYPFVATLWFLCLLAFAYVGYEQISLGCRSILGDCYVDGITYSFIFWKDVLDFGYFGVVALSVLHLLIQAVKWVVQIVIARPRRGDESD